MTRPKFTYDADCGFCTRSARWLAASGRDHFEVVPWQMLDLDASGLTVDQVTSVSYWLEDGRPVAAGSDAIGRAPTLTRWRRIGRLIQARRLRPLFHCVYRIVARNRHRMPGGDGTCELPQDR